jgi:hypothetical protein
MQNQTQLSFLGNLGEKEKSTDYFIPTPDPKKERRGTSKGRGGDMDIEG